MSFTPVISWTALTLHSPQSQDLFWGTHDISRADRGQHITGNQPEPELQVLYSSLLQVCHVDKSGQCALVHAGLKGHAEIINILLGQDWEPEIATDSQQHRSNESESGKAQAVQQAVTTAASMGHTQVRITSKALLIFFSNSSPCRARCSSLADSEDFLDTVCSCLWLRSVGALFCFLNSKPAIEDCKIVFSCRWWKACWTWKMNSWQCRWMLMTHSGEKRVHFSYQSYKFIFLTSFCPSVCF